MQPVNPIDFRPDINGLRTWAVLAVVFYHFKVPGFSGGFVGVDVFFVISGFLMTSIIIRGLERERFSIIAFYMARARRILPALLVLCAMLLVLGWFLLLPPDYKMLGTHSVTAVTFWSNLRFWDEAGYFDTSSHEKWLLHTWSLAVEWQFYLVLPLLLWGTWRLRPGRVAQTWLTSAVLVASLLACILLTPADPTQAFFGLHTRAWEMLAGGLVYLLAPKLVAPHTGKLLELSGFAMIAVSIALFDAKTSWPGYQALLPVAGAALVLWAQRTTSVFTGTPIAQWFGNRSYSIYLWHWPMVVVLVYINILADPRYVVAALVMTLLLAELSYRLVETPARLWLQQPGLGLNLVSLGATVGIVGLAGAAVWRGDGIDGRFSPSAELAAAEALNVNSRNCITDERTKGEPCRYGGPITKLILLGDSHSNAIATAVEAALPNKEDGFEQWSYAACPMILGVKPTPGTHTARRKNYNCDAYIVNAISKLKALDSAIPVLLVTRTSLALHGLNEEDGTNPPDFFISSPVNIATRESVKELQTAYVKTVCEIAKTRQVFLMRPIPEMGVNIPKVISRRLALGLDYSFELPIEIYKRRTKDAWDMQDAAGAACNAKIIDVTVALCNATHCKSAEANRPMYADDDHLSDYGNKFIVNEIRKIYEKIKTQPTN